MKSNLNVQPWGWLSKCSPCIWGSPVLPPLGAGAWPLPLSPSTASARAASPWARTLHTTLTPTLMKPTCSNQLPRGEESWDRNFHFLVSAFSITWICFLSSRYLTFVIRKETMLLKFCRKMFCWYGRCSHLQDAVEMKIQVIQQYTQNGPIY